MIIYSNPFLGTAMHNLNASITGHGALCDCFDSRGNEEAFDAPCTC